MHPVELDALMEKHDGMPIPHKGVAVCIRRIDGTEYTADPTSGEIGCGPLVANASATGALNQFLRALDLRHKTREDE